MGAATNPWRTEMSDIRRELLECHREVLEILRGMVQRMELHHERTAARLMRLEAAAGLRPVPANEPIPPPEQP